MLVILKWFFIRKHLLVIAALTSAFLPLYSNTETLPAQLSEQKAYGPIAELDCLAFKGQTVQNDGHGRPYITPLGLALRTYAQDNYRPDETLIDKGVIENTCLFTHVVSELTKDAHLQSGRAAFAREMLTLKKRPALLQKQASIRAIDASFRQDTQKILSLLAPNEKIFLEVATQQYELSPITIELTRILGPLNSAIIPLILITYASTLSIPEMKVLHADGQQERRSLEQSRSAEGRRLTPVDTIKLSLNEYLFKDTRKAAFVGSVAIPLIGMLVLKSLEGNINRWGHENINELKKKHQLYSLLYQITEGLQFVGDAARFAYLWTLFKPIKTLGSIFSPAAARNGSTIFSRWAKGLSHWKASGNLATLIERKQSLIELRTKLEKNLADARRNHANPTVIEKIEADLASTATESAQNEASLEAEKNKVEPALREIDNNYFEKEHKAYIATLEKVQAQLAHEEHIQELKKCVIASCSNIVKAAELAKSLKNSSMAPEGLLESFCHPLATSNPQEIQETISIPTHELKEHVAHWFDEVITEFKTQHVEIYDITRRDDILAELTPPAQARGAREGNPRVSATVDAKWKEIIRTVLSEEFTKQESIVRGGQPLDMTQHRVENFYNDNQTTNEQRLMDVIIQTTPLSEDEKILQRITLSGAQKTAGANLFGGKETIHRLGSTSAGRFNNPLGAAAYNYVLNHHADGTLASPASYWMLRGAQATAIPAIASIAPASMSAKHLLEWQQKNSEIQPIRKLLVSLSKYVRGASSLYQHITKNKDLMANLPPHITSYFEQFFGEKAHPALAEIISLCQHKALDKAEGFLWHVGVLGRLIDLLNEHMMRFQELSQAVGYIDYLTILSDMIAPETAVINNEGQTIQWCLPSIIETEKPYINFKGMWYPGYQPIKVISTAVSLGGENNAQHLIITGVNGCGKSIVMSAMMSVVVFAHTHGIAPAESAELCPFDLVMFHGNIDDAKIDGYSKGIAEILHSGIVLKKIVEQMNKQGQKLRAYITMDELFCSTDQETATTLAKVILDVIMQDPEAMLVFTTHNKELTSLEKEMHGKVKNAYVDTDIDVTQEKVIYKRQLCEGINKLSPALFIMKERFKESGLQDPFVLSILDKAIAYQKSQKGFGKQAA